MKKLLAIVICVAALLTLGVIATSAASQDAGYWVENATNIDEILAGQAGEGDMAWEVPYLHIKPTIDGKIDKTEYSPFEFYEDYLSWMAPVGDANSGTTEEEFKEFFESTQEDFFDAYWGWDGEYMYIAFSINCLNGYFCNPNSMGSDALLFAVNCLQVGIADAEATGKHESYQEYGFGVHTGGTDNLGKDLSNRKGESLVQNWSPNPNRYTPEAGVDFIGTYDDVNQVVVYEIRLHLQSMLGLTDRTVQNGDECNYAWLLAVNGQARTTNETWQLAFCHGIGGQYSMKMNQYFARISFTGMPEGTDIPVIELPGMSEEEMVYGLTEYIDMSDERDVATFEGVNAAVEYVTENGESFARITALSADELPYIFSNKYPKTVLGGAVNYVVIKYRTNFAEGGDLGVIYRTVNAPEYDVENCYYDIIGTDGEWYLAYFDMGYEAGWNHFITNFGLVPFVYADNPAQQTIDIQYIKFYQNDPYDYIEADMYNPNAGEDVEDTTPTEETNTEDTAAVGGVDTADVTVTVDPQTTEAPVADTQATTEDGCASVLGIGMSLALLSMAGAALVMRKKES